MISNTGLKPLYFKGALIRDGETFVFNTAETDELSELEHVLSAHDFKYKKNLYASPRHYGTDCIVAITGSPPGYAGNLSSQMPDGPGSKLRPRHFIDIEMAAELALLEAEARYKSNRGKSKEKVLLLIK